MTGPEVTAAMKAEEWTVADAIWSRIDAGDQEGAQQILREYGRTVLNAAADDWQRGEWANAPRRADQVQERIANGQFVGDWIRARAARLTATTEETPCG